MVIGADIIFIIGTAAIAGSVRQAEDHMWFRLDIAASDLDATMAPLGLKHRQPCRPFDEACLL
jgi:hypothetical protein